MKSYCIKTNNNQIIKYLLNKFKILNFANIYYCNKSFSKYENFIMHYLEDDTESFDNIVCDIVTNIIIDFYEEKIIKRIINVNYFYFETNEKLLIYDNCLNFLNEQREEIFEDLFVNIKEYIQENKRIYIEGIVNFRLNNYIKRIDNIVDLGVNQYIIEKEYKEFISLLKIYVNSSNSNTRLIHLVYMNGESILLDEEKNFIKLENNINTIQYLSDISFSSNDIALNTLLSILPSKIEIHIIDKNDEFINTLKLIFEDRVKICNDCNICRTYRKINEMKISK